MPLALPSDATPVRIPAVPVVGEGDLGRVLVQFFEEAKRSSHPRPDQEVVRRIGEAAEAASARFLRDGTLAHSPKGEVPLALLATVYRFFGCRVSAWTHFPDQGTLRIEECALRRALALVGIMDCAVACSRVRQSALRSVSQSTTPRWLREETACDFLFQFERGI